MDGETAPVESKVYAATIGTGAGAVVAAFVIWLLGVIIWHAPFTSVGATEAAAAVPAPVTGIVALAITVGGTFLGGYRAKHTPRPPEPPAPDAAVAAGWESAHARVGRDDLADDEYAAFISTARGRDVPEAKVKTPPKGDANGDGRDDKTGRYVARAEEPA